MIEYISGKIAELTPTTVTIDNNGIGNIMEISLQTYSKLDGKTEAKIYVQTQLNQRDGIQVDYGFADKAERELFRMITSVSGMGAASARMILSSMSADEFREVVLSENVNALKSVKGIGLKSAQRLVLELKDKLIKGEGASSEVLFQTASSEAVEEASSALQMLGFTKPNIQKAIQNILKANPNASVEQIIKSALHML
ncbi:MAG: Holliday junction branch migration protein RuvA [Bacteroidales bacterium]|jgi:Holliday junction DNA helicase RuvA|nr:Holliday junction branch migration protein RuvA [Bacteroidales bacterium]MCR5547652.1 Holliday junction branch migration protein RuvA [Bacteroidales bacterium]